MALADVIRNPEEDVKLQKKKAKNLPKKSNYFDIGDPSTDRDASLDSYDQYDNSSYRDDTTDDLIEQLREVQQT